MTTPVQSLKTSTVRSLMSLLLALALAACTSSAPDPDCAPTSRSLSSGERAPVKVVVAAKAGSRYVGVLDVNGGFYSAPNRTSPTGSGALTNLPAGTYRGTVARGRHLVLLVQGERFRLTEAEICD